MWQGVQFDGKDFKLIQELAPISVKDYCVKRNVHT